MIQTLTGTAVAAALALTLPLPARAQASTPAPSAAGAVAAPRFSSAFDDYRPYRELSRTDWRRLNDAVAGAPGGASGHAMEAMGTIPPDSANAPPDTPPAPASGAASASRHGPAPVARPHHGSAP